MDLRRARVNLFSLLGLVALAALVWIAPETREMGSRIKQDFRNRFQREEPAKPPETPAPEVTPPEPAQMEEPAVEPTPPPHVEKNAAGEYVPEPGYNWVNSEPGNFDVQWCPGCRHRDHPNVFAGSEEGQWQPAPGYAWISDPPEDMRVVWQAGLRHPDYEHVVAAEAETQWLPEEGYTWVDADDPENLHVVPEPPP